MGLSSTLISQTPHTLLLVMGEAVTCGYDDPPASVDIRNVAA